MLGVGGREGRKGSYSAGCGCRRARRVGVGVGGGRGVVQYWVGAGEGNDLSSAVKQGRG